MTDTPAPESLPRPDLFLRMGDKDPIKMTYGLLMDLQRLLPNPESAMELTLVDSYTQDYIIRRVMTPSKGLVTDMELLTKAEDVDLSPEDVEKLLLWVVQHILHFFAQRASQLAATGAQFKTALPSLFTRGSETSASTTPSAGPSESPSPA